MKNLVLILVLALFQLALGFPFLNEGLSEASKKLLNRQSGGGAIQGGSNCPYNPPHLHVPAAPWNPAFPYNHARNGLPGRGLGGYQVPAPGDTAHQFIAPGPRDIRGPCPGLNALANHNFLARDGITTFQELIDASQNVFNLGHDLATVLTVVAFVFSSGDIITNKVSIGCDATSRTSWFPLLTGSQSGMNGHNKFEADTSLTRNDYYQANGNNYAFNGTLFKGMVQAAGPNRIYDFDAIADYKYTRYQQGIAENPNFYFGVGAFILHGAISLIYETMPSGTRNYVADHETISTFFGAVEHADGSFSYVPERIPANWTNRAAPYTVPIAATRIVASYAKHPVLLGGKTGANGFNAINWKGIQNGTLVDFNPQTVICLIYQVATEKAPGLVTGLLDTVIHLTNWALDTLSVDMQNFGCPIPPHIKV